MTMASLDNNELRRFLDRLLLRSDLNEEERAAVLSLPVHACRIEKRRDLIVRSADTSCATLVASGLVGRFAQTNTGSRQFTSFHLAGDMIDLSSAVRTAEMIGLNALCDTTILRVPHAAIRAVAARYPAIAEAFWKDSAVDAAILAEWVVNVGRRDARTRIAHLLCELGIRSKGDQDTRLDYALPITQEQLGDATALTSVHVNRSLMALKDLVTLRGGRARISDWAELARTGDFDSGYMLADTGSERRRRTLVAA
jgi:CRP-like cAMP-binding protein